MRNWLQKAIYLSGLTFLCFFSIQSNLNAQHFIFEYTGPSIIYVDNNCIAELEWGNSTPTVDPAHPEDGQTISFFDLDNISGGYSQGDTIPPGEQVAVTYLALDNMGNDSLFTFTIDFLDTIPPLILGLPSDITVNCEDAGDLNITGSPMSVMDNCDLDPIITFSDITTGGYCTYTYTITRTWKATDDNLNATTGVQVITVEDVTSPEFIIEATDENFTCDTGANAEIAFSDWLTNLGAANASDNCTSTNSLRWFAAVPGTYDINDTLTYPGSSPGDLDTAICPSPMNGIYRSEIVDFVVYDLCGNASVTTAAFNVVDNTLPVFDYCPPDITLTNEAGLCEVVYELPVPVISDECENNIAAESFSSSQSITSSNPGDANTAVDPAVLTFTGIPAAPSSAFGPVVLKIDLLNTDAEAPEEYFAILGEDDSTLGQTNNSVNQCDSSTTTVIIAASDFNSWTSDGELTITLSPNIPGGQENLAINDICGGSVVNAFLEYNSNTPNSLIFEYSINASAPVLLDPISAIGVILPVGINSINYFATDCSGNMATCVYTVTVEDLEAPEIICPSDITDMLGPGEDCNLGVEVSLPLPVSIEDNCAFQTNIETQPTDPNEALLTFSFDPGYLNYIADDKTIVFPGTAANAVGSTVTLSVVITGDADDLEEFFTIFSEDNTDLGTTEVGQPNVTVDTFSCPDLSVNITTISIPVSLFNEWASDGNVSFNAVSNTNFNDPPPGGSSDGINPSCITFPPGTPDGTNDGLSNILMELSYEYTTPSYFADGATVIPTTTMVAPNIAPTEAFNIGVTTVYYFIEDIAGNSDTCSFEVSIGENVPPDAICQATTIFVNPSGFDTYILEPAEVDGGSMDNCSIENMSVSPNSFTCDQQGMIVPVTLTVTDVYGNTDSCVAMVNVETAQPIPSYAIGLCGNDTLSLFANPPPTGGSPNFTFLWNGPNSFVSVEENPQIPNADPTYSGTYAVTITGETGCTAVSTVEVSINASPDIPIISVNNNVLCSSDELILSSQTYSGNMVTYYWYEGIPPTGTFISSTSIPSLTIPAPLLAGATNYFVQVEVDGCFSLPSDFETVTVTQAPIATVNDPVISVCEGENIILGTSETGPNYTYAWTGPNGFNSSLQNPPTIIATLADNGTYTLIISDNICPSSPVTTEVNVTATLSTPTISSTGIACEGGNITLMANLIDGDFYTWTAPDFSIFITTSNLLLISGVTPSDAGDWTVVVTINNCDSEISDPYEIFVEPGLSVLPTNNSPVCSSEEVQLSVNSIPGATYSWSGPSGFTSFIQNPLAPAIAGTYTVTITSSNGCSNSANTEVDVDASPIITGLSNDGASCMNGVDDIHLIATIFPTDDGSYTYLWTGDNGFNSTEAIPTLPNATSSDNGSYTLVVTDGNGCSSLPTTTVVNVSDVPITPSIEGPSQLCETEDFTLTTQDYNGNNVVYSWQTPIGNFETMTPSLTIISATSLNSGIYQLEVTVDGCESNPSIEVIVEVNPIPAAPIASSNAPVCSGTSIELFTDSIPGALYVWTGPIGYSSSGHNPIIFDASVDDEGAYSVQVTIDGCSSGFSVPVNVMISPTPSPPAVTNNGPICIDDSGSSLVLSVSPADAIPGASYTWYNAQSGVQVGGPTTALNTTIVDFSIYAEGIYDFYVIAELNGCPAVSSIPTSVIMNTIPNITAFAGDDINICNETNVSLNADLPGLGTGMWTQVSGQMATIANPNSATSMISDLSAGNSYTFQWSLSNGACVDYDSDEIIVIVDEDIEEAEAGLNFDVCNETSTLLNAIPSNSGAIGIWTQTSSQSNMGVVIVDPFDPNSAITGLEANEVYIFTWSLSNAGCGEFSSNDVVVSVEENNEIAFAGDDFLSCGDGNTQLNAAVPESGTGTWSTDDPEILFIDSNDPQTIAQGLQSGIYTFTWNLDKGACGLTSDEIEIEYEIAPEAIDDEFTVNYSSSASFNVLNNDLLEGPVQISVFSNPINGTVENMGNGVFEYTANATFTGTDQFSYQICSQACEDVCSEAIVLLRIGDDVECEVPTIFTPNNDGVNDAFIIPCLSTGSHPQNSVSIINQWGEEVFHAAPYFNDWEGTYDGQDLPVGTYFFIMKFNANQQPVSGFLVLER